MFTIVTALRRSLVRRCWQRHHRPGARRVAVGGIAYPICRRVRLAGNQLRRGLVLARKGVAVLDVMSSTCCVGRTAALGGTRVHAELSICIRRRPQLSSLRFRPRRAFLAVTPGDCSVWNDVRLLHRLRRRDGQGRAVFARLLPSWGGEMAAARVRAAAAA